MKNKKLIIYYDIYNNCHYKKKNSKLIVRFMIITSIKIFSYYINLKMVYYYY